LLNRLLATNGTRLSYLPESPKKTGYCHLLAYRMKRLKRFHCLLISKIRFSFPLTSQMKKLKRFRYLPASRKRFHYPLAYRMKKLHYLVDSRMKKFRYPVDFRRKSFPKPLAYLLMARLMLSLIKIA
jgi:hypothetical protein